MRLVDNRGLECPQPVINTQRELAAHPDEDLAALVDSATARDNLVVLAEGLGLAAEWTPDGTGFRVVIRRGAPTPRPGETREEPTRSVGGGPLVVALASDRLGQGDEALGAILMKSFLTSLAESEPPATVICLNRGVFLSTAASPVLGQLERLAAQGTEILSCGTCLDFYERKGELKVGKVSNMLTILERMASAGRLIQW